MHLSDCCLIALKVKISQGTFVKFTEVKNSQNVANGFSVSRTCVGDWHLSSCSITSN